MDPCGLNCVSPKRYVEVFRLKYTHVQARDFLGGTSGKEPACQCRGHRGNGFKPGLGEIPWRRAWQPTPVFLTGEFLGQRNLVGYSPEIWKESHMTKETEHIHTHGQAERQA